MVENTMLMTRHDQQGTKSIDMILRGDNRDLLFRNILVTKMTVEEDGYFNIKS